MRWKNPPRDVMVVQAARKLNSPCKDTDSGASVFSRNDRGEAVKAVGIVMSSSATGCSFTHIGHALDIMGQEKDIQGLHLITGL